MGAWVDASSSPGARRLAVLVGIGLAATFLIPRGANDADGLVMPWTLASRVPTTWVTTVFPLLAGAALIAVGARRVPESGVTAALLLAGIVPSLVLSARIVAEESSSLGVLASGGRVGWLVAATLCVPMLINRGGDLSRRGRFLFLAGVALLLLQLLVPSTASVYNGSSCSNMRGMFTPQVGLWKPFRMVLHDWGTDGGFERLLGLLVHLSRLGLCAIGLILVRKKSVPIWLVSLVVGGLVLDVVVKPAWGVIELLFERPQPMNLLNRALLNAMGLGYVFAFGTSLYRLNAPPAASPVAATLVVPAHSSPTPRTPEARAAEVAAAAAVAATPGDGDDTAMRLAKLKRLAEAGVITKDEYERKRAEIVASL